MEINLNFIYKTVAAFFVVLAFYFLFNNFFGSNSEKKANESAIRQMTSQLTKLISVQQDDSGNYGVVVAELPFTGCELQNSYLDNPEVQTILVKLGGLSSNSLKCISDGNGKEIKSWAISVQIAQGKYWCVDETGDRVELKKEITKPFCR